MKAFLLAATLLALAAGPVSAGLTRAEIAATGVAVPAGARVPLGLAFRDDTGALASLAFDPEGPPTVLLFADYTCQTMCGAAATVAAAALEGAGLGAGQDYRALVVGLDPKDGPAAAAAAKAAELADFPEARAAFQFLAGDQAEIEALAAALGYRYAYDAEHDQFAHSAALYVLAPDGRVARALAGLTLTGRDLRLALVEAGEGRVGTLADRVRLLCYGFDAAQGVYTPAITALLQGGAVVTLAALGGFVLVLQRRATGGGGEAG